MQVNIFKLRMKKTKLFFLMMLATMTWTFFLVVNDLKAEEFGVEYETLGFQYDLIDNLVQNNIPFYIDNDGVIKINDNYAELTKKIMREIETRPTTKVANRKYASAIALLFNKNGIKYIVREDINTGETHFMWSREDDEKALKITGEKFMKVVKESYNTGRLGDYSLQKP